MSAGEQAVGSKGGNNANRPTVVNLDQFLLFSGQMTSKYDSIQKMT
jgi:hypothetical protein